MNEREKKSTMFHKTTSNDWQWFQFLEEFSVTRLASWYEYYNKITLQARFLFFALYSTDKLPHTRAPFIFFLPDTDTARKAKQLLASWRYSSLSASYAYN